MQCISLTGLSPSMVHPSRRLSYTKHFLLPDSHVQEPDCSHYPRCTTDTSYTYTGFRLFPVRSPLLRKSQFVSFPAGTKMFQFPALDRVSTGRRLFAPNRGLSQLAPLRRFGNINPMSIAYASRPQLRTRLTRRGSTWRRKP